MMNKTSAKSASTQGRKRKMNDLEKDKESFKRQQNPTLFGSSTRENKENIARNDRNLNNARSSDDEDQSMSESTKNSKARKQVKFAEEVKVTYNKKEAPAWVSAGKADLLENDNKAVHQRSQTEDELEEKSLINEYLSKKNIRSYKIVSEFMNEFNCNSNETEIYCRAYEKAHIKEYIADNHQESKSGLIYVWGHPGTGKTSIIRVILQEIMEEMKKNSTLRNSLVIFNYNGMIFKRLYDFSTELIKDVRLKLDNKESKNLEAKLKQTDDVTDLAHRIQKYFLKHKHVHKLVIIDEVDNLSMTESARNFVSFLHSILKSDTNTTIVGIANSVDLISKVSQIASKESELVESKWVFQPYSEKDITKIIQKKMNRFIDEHPAYKEDIESMVEPKALELLAKKVSKISGDIRVAFDLLKSALITIALKFKEEALKARKLKKKLKDEEEEEKATKTEEKEPIKKSFTIDINDPKVTVQLILYLSTTKFGIKSIEIIRQLPSSSIVILKTLAVIYDENNLAKNYRAWDVFVSCQKTLRKLGMNECEFSDFWQGLKMLENYGLINYSENKNKKNSKVSLKADIEEIKKGLVESKVFRSMEGNKQ